MIKIIVVVVLILIAVFLLYLFLTTEHRTISTYNYRIHDAINEKEQFLLVLQDDIFNRQSVWVSARILGTMEGHPAIEVTYTLMKFQKKASVSNISCTLINKDTIVEKWN